MTWNQVHFTSSHVRGFWTFVGRYVRQINFQQIEIADAIYFTKPGATFDILCSKGLVLSGQSKSLYHGPFKRLIVPAGGVYFNWLAETPWVK